MLQCAESTAPVCPVRNVGSPACFRSGVRRIPTVWSAEAEASLLASGLNATRLHPAPAHTTRARRQKAGKTLRAPRALADRIAPECCGAHAASTAICLCFGAPLSRG
eukprot:2452936-Rhodomonas_salina.1